MSFMQLIPIKLNFVLSSFDNMRKTLVRIENFLTSPKCCDTGDRIFLWGKDDLSKCLFNIHTNIHFPWL